MKPITKLMLPMLTSASLLSVGVLANEQPYDEIKKQLNIMSNVIATTVAQSSSESIGRVRSIETTYLAGQGALMVVNSTTRAYSIGGFDFDMPDFNFGEFFVTSPGEPPEPPVAPEPVQVVAPRVSSSLGDSNIRVIIDDALAASEYAYEHAMDQMREGREHYRELKQKERELSYELRELEREKRELEIRKKYDEDKKSLEKEYGHIDKKQSELAAAKEKLSKKLEEYQQRQNKLKEEQSLKSKQFYQDISFQIAEGLCLYGNGLRALPDNENVTVIIKNAGDAVGKEKQDTIYVFSKSLIKRCVSDSIKTKDLLAKAVKYQF